jgi:hypothetical protein
MGIITTGLGGYVASKAGGAGKHSRAVAAYVTASWAVTAGEVSDGAAVNGEHIALGAHRKAAVLVRYFLNQVTEDETFSLKVERDYSYDGGSTWEDDLTTVFDGVVVTGAADGGSGNLPGVLAVDDDLAALRLDEGVDTIMYTITPAFSANSGDSGTWDAIALLGANVSGGGSGEAATGLTVDRVGFQSAVVSVAWQAKLAPEETLSLAVTRQQSEDGATWDAAETVQASTIVATGAEVVESVEYDEGPPVVEAVDFDPGGFDGGGTLELDQPLGAVKQFVRYNVTPTLSAPDTDECEWGLTVTLGGADSLPVEEE